MSFALKISAKMVRKPLATQGCNSREPRRSCLCAAWLHVVSFMKWRSKSLIKFQVVSCSLIFASLYSASGQSSPTPRASHSAAWDAARGQVVIFGGSDGLSPTDETWIWNGLWTLKNPVDRPPPIAFANMAYDQVRQQVVLFGGSQDATSGLLDTWIWDGNVWTGRFATNPPPARF